MIACSINYYMYFNLTMTTEKYKFKKFQISDKYLIKARNTDF